MLPTKKENPHGFHRKYNITKADGSPCDPEAVYLVLRLDGTSFYSVASRMAAKVYAENTPAEKMGEDLLQMTKRLGDESWAEAVPKVHWADAMAEDKLTAEAAKAASKSKVRAKVEAKAEAWSKAEAWAKSIAKTWAETSAWAKAEDRAETKVWVEIKAEVWAEVWAEATIRAEAARAKADAWAEVEAWTEAEARDKAWELGSM